MNFELFTAMYDPNTNEIVGCKEGSLVYWHEFRHQLQYQNIIAKTWNYIELIIIRIIASTMAFYALFISNSVNDERVAMLAFAGLLLIPSFIITMVLEIDAWIYAFKRKHYGNK